MQPSVGAMGLASAVVGLVFLLFTFVMAYSVFQTYKAATPSS
jgi:hypothetical protein